MMPPRSPEVRGPIEAWELVVSIEPSIRRYCKLLHATYSRFMDESVEFDDVLQQGFLGAFRAAQLFEEERGCEFITFAAYWIRSSVQDLFRNRLGLTRLGDGTSTVRRISFVEGTTSEDGPEPKWVLDLVSRSAVDPVDTIHQKRCLREISPALSTTRAGNRWAYVLHARIFQGKTLAEVGNKLGVCRERIRKMEADALGHLRREFLDRFPEEAKEEFCPARQSARMTACRDRISSNTSESA